MKHMKKLIAVMLTFVMTFAMAATVFAADITINDETDGSTYSAYKLLDATDGGDGKFSYTLNTKYETVLKEVTGKTTSSEIIQYIAGLNTDGIRTFADAVYTKIKNMNNITADATTKTKAFTGIDKGYYLIAETAIAADENTYSLVMLDTVGNDSVTVNTKKNVPTLEKKVQEKNDSTGYESDWQDGADYDVNDKVPFKLTGTVSADYASYKTYYYAFHDKMSSGLTFDLNDIEVKVDGTKVDKNKYTVVTDNADGCTFEVVFNDLKKVEGVTATSKITVEYKATLNDQSVIGSTGNPNEARLEYNNNPYYDGTGKPGETGKTPWDKVIVFTYKLVANKVDKDGKALEGAGFTLYKLDNATGNFVKVGNEIKGDDNNKITTFTFDRLDAGQYKLVETTVPAGYNKADDLIFTVEATYDTEATNPTFKDLVIKDSTGKTISGENKVFTINLAEGSFTTNIKNLSGTELPSTGGMGTTIFYIVGAILIIGAGVLMITRRRMNNN